MRIACATKPIIRDAKKEPSHEFKKPVTMTPKEILRQLRYQSDARRY